MFWHVVRFRFRPDVSEEDRAASEDGVRGLSEVIPEIRFVRLARSIDEPDVSGLIMGFDDADGFKQYNAHPAHTPVAHTIDGLCRDVVRVDMLTDDDPRSFGG